MRRGVISCSSLLRGCCLLCSAQLPAANGGRKTTQVRAFLHPLVCDKDKQGSGEGAQVSPVLSARSLPLSQQHTPLGSTGIYIRTLIEGSPAAADGRLAIGDRILAVNGTSLIGADYQRWVTPHCWGWDVRDGEGSCLGWGGRGNGEKKHSSTFQNRR